MIFENTCIHVSANVSDTIQEKLIEAIREYGGQIHHHLVAETTHVVNDQLDVFQFPNSIDSPPLVASPQWVFRSVALGKLLPPSRFPTGPSLFFSGAYVCTTHIPLKSRNILFAYVAMKGGSFTTTLTEECTHLVCGAAEGPKYEFALRCPSIQPVTLLWYNECVRRECLLDVSSDMMAQRKTIDAPDSSTSLSATRLRDGEEHSAPMGTQTNASLPHEGNDTPDVFEFDAVVEKKASEDRKRRLHARDISHGMGRNAAMDLRTSTRPIGADGSGGALTCACIDGTGRYPPPLPNPRCDGCKQVIWAEGGQRYYHRCYMGGIDLCVDCHKSNGNDEAYMLVCPAQDVQKPSEFYHCKQCGQRMPKSSFSSPQLFGAHVRACGGSSSPSKSKERRIAKRSPRVAKRSKNVAKRSPRMAKRSTRSRIAKRLRRSRRFDEGISIDTSMPDAERGTISCGGVREGNDGRGHVSGDTEANQDMHEPHEESVQEEEREVAMTEKDQSSIEKDQSSIEKDQSLVDKDQSSIDKDQSLVEKDQSLVEKDLSMSEIVHPLESSNGQVKTKSGGESDGPLHGCVFIVEGYSDGILSSIEHHLTVLGGRVVHDVGAHRITHVLSASLDTPIAASAIPYHPHPSVVSVHWLQECVDLKALLPPPTATALNYVNVLHHPPPSSVGIQGMEGLYITITGFLPHERMLVKDLIARVGATFTGFLCPKNTHVICEVDSKKGTPHARAQARSKLAKASKWNLPVVSNEWLLACAHSWSMVPCDPYRLPVKRGGSTNDLMEAAHAPPPWWKRPTHLGEESSSTMGSTRPAEPIASTTPKTWNPPIHLLSSAAESNKRITRGDESAHASQLPVLESLRAQWCALNDARQRQFLNHWKRERRNSAANGGGMDPVSKKSYARKDAMEREDESLKDAYESNAPQRGGDGTSSPGGAAPTFASALRSPIQRLRRGRSARMVSPMRNIQHPPHRYAPMDARIGVGDALFAQVRAKKRRMGSDGMAMPMGDGEVLRLDGGECVRGVLGGNDRSEELKRKGEEGIVTSTKRSQNAIQGEEDNDGKGEEEDGDEGRGEEEEEEDDEGRGEEEEDDEGREEEEERIVTMKALRGISPEQPQDTRVVCASTRDDESVANSVGACDPSAMVVCLSGFHPSKAENIRKEIVRMGAEYSIHFSKRCTHLILASPKRTVKFFACCARGLWILQPSYIEACVKADEFVHPWKYSWEDVPFEGPIDLKVIELARERGRAFRDWLFFLGDTTVPPRDALRTIIEAGDGTVRPIKTSKGILDAIGSSEWSVVCAVVSQGVRSTPALRMIKHLGVPVVSGLYVTTVLCESPSPSPEEFAVDVT